MDFEFILRVAERRIKAALGKADAGKILFTQMCRLELQIMMIFSIEESDYFTFNRLIV